MDEEWEFWEYDDGGGVGVEEPPPIDGLNDPGFAANLTPPLEFPDQGYYDNGDGSWTGEDGLLYNNAGEWIGVDFGDGTWADIDGNIYGADGVPLGTIDEQGGGFWAGVGNFFSKLFGGGSASAQGGGFGGGGSFGQQSASQQAQRAAQQLAQARAAGASQQQIDALQRQLLIAQLAARGGASMSDSTKTILIAGGAVALAYALASRRNDSSR